MSQQTLQQPSSTTLFYQTNIAPICARWHKVTSLDGPVECFIALLALFVVFVILKHIIFHTFYYYFQRTGRASVTSLINRFSGKSLTQRILSKNDKFSSAGEVHQTIRNFSESRYYERVPSLFDSRKSKCFENFITEETRKIILFLDDNAGEELWRTLKLCKNQHEIFVVLDHNPDSNEIQKVLEGVLKQAQPKNVKISFVKAKSGLALDGVFDLAYFGHNPKNYLSSLSKIEQHMEPEHTTLLANHVVQGQDDGALDFLMHVRRNPKKFSTEMEIASLEGAVYDKLLLDGIEIVRLVKN